MSDTERQNQEHTAEAAETQDEVLLSWVSHPARHRPVVTALLAIFLTILVALVYELTASVVFSTVAALVLWGSLSQFFLPTRFELTDKGVRIKYTISSVRKEWKLFRTYYVDKNGVLLSPFVRPSRLENFRGIYVRFAGNKDEVVKIVGDRIDMPLDDIEE